MTLRRAVRLGAVAVIMVGLAAWWLSSGRDGTSDDEPSWSVSSPAATSSPGAVPGPTPLDYSTTVLVSGKVVVPEEVDASHLGDALSAGRLADVQSPVLGSSDRESGLGIVAVTESGLLLAAQNPPIDPTTGHVEQVSVGLLDRDGTFRSFPSIDPPGVYPDVPRQSEAFDTRGSLVAWAETPSMDLQFDNWAVFVADLETGDVRSLGSSEDVLPNDLLPIIGPYMDVSIGDDRVYWGTPVPLGAKGADGHYGDFRLDVVARLADGSGELETIARGAIMPAADGACVAYARVHGSDPSIADGRFAIARRCTGGEERTVATGSLGSEGRIGSLAAGDGLVAWSTWEVGDDQTVARSDIVVLDPDRALAASVPLGTNVVADLVVDASLLHWTTDGSDTVLDLADGTVWSLPAVPGYYNIYQTAEWLGWRTQDVDGDSVGFASGRWHRG